MKIYLIGMPGSGKTTLGRSLADRLSLPFVDLDREIEEKEGKKIAEIFSTKGEDHFRLVESQTLNEWASRRESFILATGGGAPCFYHGIDTMNSTGLTIFLDVPIHELVLRTAKSDRPLLRNEGAADLQKRLERLAEKRMDVYRKATIVAPNPTVESVLKKLQLRK